MVGPCSVHKYARPELVASHAPVSIQMVAVCPTGGVHSLKKNVVGVFTLSNPTQR